MADFVMPAAGVMSPPKPQYRAFDDVTATRKALFDNTLDAFKRKFPISNDRYTLRLGDLSYNNARDFGPSDQKKAIMRGRTLGWNLSGAWELLDNKTGKVVDRTKKQMVAQVPYMTDRGTFIYNGNEYTIAGQMRLRPGVYSRVKDNGIIEAHFNVKGGTGPSFRVHMEPDTGVFRMHVGQANLKLYPILKAMGYDDRQLLQAWGKDLLHANVAATDPRAVQRAYHKLVREPKPAPAQQTKAAQDDDANRRRAGFVGTIVCDDSNAEKPWVYVKVHEGLAEAAWEALHLEEPIAEKRIELPHISVIRNDEAQKLVDHYGKKWKTICGNGRKVRFSLQNAMVDLNPEGWDDMDRVWFLEVRSPQLRAYRKSLGLSEMPRGESGKEFQFHITIGVLSHKSNTRRGRSVLDPLFDNAQDKAKAAFVRLEGMIKDADSKIEAEKVEVDFLDGLDTGPDTLGKLAMAIDSGMTEVTDDPIDLYHAQAQAINDNEGNPAVVAARKRQAEVRDENEATDTTKPTKIQRMLARLKARRGDPPDINYLDDVKAACEQLVGRGMVKEADDKSYGPKMREVFEKMELDPDTTEQTLGKRVHTVTPDTIIDATKKLMAINRQEAETDDRDSLAFQQIIGPEDMFPERVKQDAGGLARRMLWRATFRGSTKGIGPGVLSPQLRSVLLKSGLAAPLEEVNPLEVFDQLVRVTRMGEGGMPSSDSIPDEARGVNPSHLGYIDPIRAPEGMNIGVDSRVTHRAYKGKDGQIYSDMLDARTGKLAPVSAQQAAKSIVAFPGELQRQSEKVRAMVRGKQVEYVDRSEVDYALPAASSMFTSSSNLVPLVSGVKGGRLLMGAKFALQALPLRGAEAPLVQSAYDDGSGRSFHDVYGKHVGAIRAEQDGIVREVGKGHIKVQYADGTVKRHELYDNFPYNSKTFLHNTPMIRAGDRVPKGGLLAKSNYTNDEGTVALGRNLRVGYLAYRGYNADDAIVISESASKSLSSEHMYTTKFKTQDNYEVGRNEHLSLFPGRFDKKQLATIGDNGVVRPGTVLNYGDPVVLAVEKSKPSGRGVIRGRKPIYKDASVTWDHESPGTVTDVDRMKGGWKVLTRAYSPMNVGDKLSNSYGGKGVVSRILPDDQMPHDKDGKPMEILLSPLGVVSRINPSQLIEAALGKVAKKTGKAYRLPGFSDTSLVDFAKQELQRNGLSDTEDLYDPTTRRKIPKVFTGYAYIMKLHHMAEKKASGRDIGTYTSEGTPARGGDEGSKRLGSQELNALISHNATAVLRDAKVVRGQRNDDYWRALRLGYPPPSPKVPMVYEKFLAHLQGAGINLKKDGDVMNLMAMTDKDIDDKSNGEITLAETVRGRDDLDPVEGGLFDFAKTGGHGGGKWTHIKLASPIPNPVMEEPIRRILGLTQKKFEDVIAGKERIKAGTGTQAIHAALKSVNLDQSIQLAEQMMREGTGGKRDDAIKLLGYLRTLKKAGMTPGDLMMTKVPVIPPAFRPITAFNGMQMSADPNFLYMDLMKANEDYAALREEMGEEHSGEERLSLYNSFKAVAGLGDPVSAKSQQQKVKGLLKHVFGSSPKCYDDATDVLTERGWLPFAEYDGTVRLATVNPDTGMFEWQQPSAITHEPYSGKMVHTRTSKIDLLVTPNHKHFVSRRAGRGARSRWSPFAKVEAAKLVGSVTRVRYKCAADGWHGSVPAFAGADPMAFAEFVGWWLAEGWNHPDGAIAYVCQVAQSPHVGAIDDVFARLGLPYDRRHYPKKNNIIYWSIKSQQLVRWLRKHIGEGAANKRLSPLVRGWDAQYLERLLAGYLGGEAEHLERESGSCTHPNRSALTNGGMRFSTTSHQLVDDLQELAVKIGLRVKLCKVVDFDNPKWARQYRCSVLGWPTAVVEYRHETSLVDYSGGVHCATVPNGLLIVRRNGLTAVSGNSGMYQRRVLGAAVDTVGRGVITPNPSLNMDQVGLPEEKAWVLYRPFTMRHLVRRGMQATAAAKAIEDKSAVAKQALTAAMAERPVIINRAPVLHKYGMMAAWPVLVKGHTLQVPPMVTSGFNADFDGDAMNYHVPVSDDAVQDAVSKMLPSRNLLAVSDFDVHYYPKQEFLHGLHIASTAKKRGLKTFRSKEDVLKAYRRGELDVGDQVDFNE